MPGDLGRELGDADDAADQDAATYAAAGDAGGHDYAHGNGHDADADQTYDYQCEQNLYYPIDLSHHPYQSEHLP
jgi:hypothetical protein